jgi:hypothetical protein
MVLSWLAKKTLRALHVVIKYIKTPKCIYYNCVTEDVLGYETVFETSPDQHVIVF